MFTKTWRNIPASCLVCIALTLGEVFLLEQPLAAGGDLVDARLVGLQLLLEVLVLLHLAVQVGGVQVGIVGGELQLLVDPAWKFYGIRIRKHDTRTRQIAPFCRMTDFIARSYITSQK